MSKEKNKTEYFAIRVEKSTKELVDKKLKRMNSDPLSDKVKYSLLVEYLVKKMTPEDEKELQKLALTWETEEKRLKHLYEKKKGKVSPKRWRELTLSGQLISFFKEHSRLSIVL